MKKTSDKSRFGLMSRFVVDLIKAEEAYLEASGWSLVEVDGCFSSWRNPQFDMVFTRNHAVTITKSSDQNIGPW